ncbi:hypothetical protein MKW92_037659, partial [Papaver armeniacum]
AKATLGSSFSFPVHSPKKQAGNCVCCGCLPALIRHNKRGVSAFRQANGYGALRDALGSDNVTMLGFKDYVVLLEDHPLVIGVAVLLFAGLFVHGHAQSRHA